jgi:hypothetical protein
MIGECPLLGNWQRLALFDGKCATSVASTHLLRDIPPSGFAAESGTPAQCLLATKAG